MTDMMGYRVEKRRALVTITFASGQTLDGAFFLSPLAEDHAGPERIYDLLNTPRRFLPFQVDADTDAPRVILYNRAEILTVTLPEEEIELVHDPSYQIARRETVSVLFSTGKRLVGEFHITELSEYARLSDVASLRKFIYFETADQTNDRQPGADRGARTDGAEGEAETWPTRSTPCSISWSTRRRSWCSRSAGRRGS